jgi:hypoxanthine phosphoribosyltransferase
MNMKEDIERILFSQTEIAAKVREIGAKITADYRGKRPLLIGVLKGCAIFMSDLARAVDLPCEFEFMRVSSYGAGVKTSGAVEILMDVGCDISGRDVLLVEDILDSGLTLSYLIAQLKARKPASLKICALLEKPDRRQVDVPIDYLGFVIDDVFVVGYGLDYAGRYRNLPYVGELKRALYEV